jgi:hypothetical protein
MCSAASVLSCDTIGVVARHVHGRPAQACCFWASLITGSKAVAWKWRSECRWMSAGRPALFRMRVRAWLIASGWGGTARRGR